MPWVLYVFEKECVSCSFHCKVSACFHKTIWIIFETQLGHAVCKEFSHESGVFSSNNSSSKIQHNRRAKSTVELFHSSGRFSDNAWWQRFECLKTKVWPNLSRNENVLKRLWRMLFGSVCEDLLPPFPFHCFVLFSVSDVVHSRCPQLQMECVLFITVMNMAINYPT